jgi:hypothetical protein
MSDALQPPRLADLHRDSRDCVIAIARALDGRQAAAPVPGTPLWSVRELLSHIVGCPVALLAGEVEGAGSEPWTQAQVEARRDTAVSDLIAELEGAGSAIDAGLSGGALPSPIVFDLITHEQDLRGAVGAALQPDSAAIRLVVDQFGARAAAISAKAGLPPLRLLDPDTGWSVGDDGGIVGTASEFEWSRVLTGRRSNAQVIGLAWSGDPAAYLDLLSLFGPLAAADIAD